MTKDSTEAALGWLVALGFLGMLGVIGWLIIR